MPRCRRKRGEGEIMTNDEIAEQKNKAIRRALSALVEHFDTALILVSAKDANGNYGFVYNGFGDPSAQRGLACEFAFGRGEG